MPYISLTELQDNPQAKFDFIVVGGGSAGCPLASRLSEDGSVRVLLVEAGPAVESLTSSQKEALQIPAFVGAIQHTPLDWEYYADPQAPHACVKFQNSQSFWPRGKLMGGSSQLNYLMYCRGHPQDYNSWQQSFGLEGWSAVVIGQLFQRIENVAECANVCSNCHGQKGPLGLSETKPTNSLATAFCESAVAAIPDCQKGDYNCFCSKEPNKPVVGLHQQTVRQGTRCDTSRAYIEPIIHQRRNLFVLTDTNCQNIITNKDSEGNVQAIGVNLQSNNTQLKVRCQKEVILSAGALASPQILLQSGIGPSLPVKHLFHVGKNLQDHMVCYLHFQAAKPHQDIGSVTAPKAIGNFWKTIWNKLQLYLFHSGILHSTAYDASVFFSSEEFQSLQKPFPDLQISALCTPTDVAIFQDNIRMDLSQFSFDGDREGLVLCHTLLHPKSVGSVQLKQSNVNNNNNNNCEITIQANYWTDKASSDIQRMTEALKQGFRIGTTKPLSGVLEASPVLPKDLLQKYKLSHTPGPIDLKQIPDAFWEEYIRQYATTLYHPVGTGRMGKSENEGVVDDRLKVFGVRNLRIVDASIQPEIVSGNTNASCVVIGERAADILKADYNLLGDTGVLDAAVAKYEAKAQRKLWFKALVGGVVGVTVVAGMSLRMISGMARSRH